MIKFIRNLFNSRKQQCNIPVVTHRCSPLEAHNQLLIERVIELLKFKPEYFSARWFGGSMNSSILSKDNKILIMIETGQIIKPIEPKMTITQLNTIKQLVKPIVEKDSKYLIDDLLNGW